MMSLTSSSYMISLTLSFSIIFYGMMSEASGGGCKGEQSYRLRITMRWVPEEDNALPKVATVPAVFAVAHTPNFTLFKVGEKLDREMVDFLRNQKPSALSEKLRRNVAIENGSVVQFDKATAIDPTDVVRLTVELDGDKNATLVSFIGLVFPTPDFFFGISGLNMCNGTHFLDMLPENRSILWAGAYDGGIDARRNISQIPFTVSEAVTVDNRTSLRNGYATYNLTPGSYRRPVWKIYAIAGGLAFFVFIALTSLCVVNHSKKKRKKIRADAQIPASGE